MKKGHRRTQSQNIFNHSSNPKLKIKVGTQTNHKRMLSLIKGSTRIKKQKTVCIEALDLPKSKSQHSDLFIFGKRDGQQSTLANSPFSQYLLSIPERKPVSHYSLQKGLKKEHRKTPTKNISKQKVKSKIEQHKKGNPYLMNISKVSSNRKALKKKDKKEQAKQLFYKKSLQRTEKKKQKVNRK